MELMTWSDGKLEERLERIDERFAQVDKRFEQVDKRFEQVDKSFEQVDKRFDRIEGDIRELKQGLGSVQATLNYFIIGAATGWVVLMGTIFIKGF
jgi:archaellum component FlaC